MQRNRIGLLAGAVVASALTLPMTWMTISNAQIQGPMGQMMNSAFGGLTLDVTGLNGHVTILFKTPLWFVAGLCAAASGLQLARMKKVFAVPRAVEWGTALLSTVWVLAALGICLMSDQASPGLGVILAVAASGIPVWTLVTENSSPTTDSESA